MISFDYFPYPNLTKFSLPFSFFLFSPLYVLCQNSFSLSHWFLLLFCICSWCFLCILHFCLLNTSVPDFLFCSFFICNLVNFSFWLHICLLISLNAFSVFSYSSVVSFKQLSWSFIRQIIDLVTRRLVQQFNLIKIKVQYWC